MSKPMQDKAELAISDVDYIRSILDRKGSKTGYQIEVVVTALIASVALLFLSFEVFNGNTITKDFLASASNKDLLMNGLIQMSVVLALILTGIYALAWKRAKSANSTLSRTLSRSYPQLQLEQLLPDIILKFSLLCLVIIIRKPEIVSPLLMIFVGDYTLQGRFFRLPKIFRMVLGLVIYLTAAYLLLNSITSVVIPLLSVVFISAFSIFNSFQSIAKKAEL